MRWVCAEMTFGVFAAASVAVSGFSSRAPNHYSKSAARALRLWLSLLIRSRFGVFRAGLARHRSAPTPPNVGEQFSRSSDESRSPRNTRSSSRRCSSMRDSDNTFSSSRAQRELADVPSEKIGIRSKKELSKFFREN